MDNNLYDEIKKPSTPYNIKPSKFEGFEAIHTNKKYWKKIFEGFDVSSPTEENESKQLASVLPRELYQRVCDILSLPVMPSAEEQILKDLGKRPRRLLKEPLLSYRKSLYIDREMDSDTDVEFSASDDEDTLNVHRELLKKPVREQITWATRYLLPETEDEKSLVKKADDLTNRIAEEFCEYMKQLGGNQQSQLFTPKAIKDLFQIEFDTEVARGLRVVPKELPAVEEQVAVATAKPEKSRRAVLEREVTKDIRAEHRPNNLRAFGQSLPLKEQWRAPDNDTENMWRSARRVPKDLVTLKTVWDGITNLRSVKEYCRWMIDHPQYRRAPYLSSLGMFDAAVLRARLTYELKNTFTPPLTTPDNAVAPIDDIRKRLSEITENN